MQLWMATSVIFEIWLLQICKRQKMSVKDWQATSIYRTVLPYYSKSRILQRKSIRVSIIEQNSKKETTLTNFLEEISFLHRGPVAQNYSRIHLITVNSWKGTFRRIKMKNISCVHSVDGCWVFTQLDYHQSWFHVEASAHFTVWGVNPLFHGYHHTLTTFLLDKTSEPASHNSQGILLQVFFHQGLSLLQV